MKKWIVKIKSPAFMAGIHRFKTKRAAEQFVLAWLKANNDGYASVVGPYKSEVS